MQLCFTILTCFSKLLGTSQNCEKVVNHSSISSPWQKWALVWKRWLIVFCDFRPSGCSALVQEKLLSETSRLSQSVLLTSSSTLPRWERDHLIAIWFTLTMLSKRIFFFYFWFLLYFLCLLQGSSNSYAIKKKDELERVAKSNR